MRCGPIRHRLEQDLAADSMERRLVVHATGFDPELGDHARIQDVYRELVEDESRNRRICDDVRQVVADGRSCLVLTEWWDHLDSLAVILQSCGVPSIVLQGGVEKEERLSRVAGLNHASPEGPVLVLATGTLVGEGFDLSRLDTLVLAFPIAFRGRVIQYAGRILRSHPVKPGVAGYDYRDGRVPVLARMQARRRKTFEGVGFVEDGGSGWSPAGRTGCQGSDHPGSR